MSLHRIFQTVAFSKLGHYSVSVDLKESSSPGYHHKGDVFDVIDDGWDLMVGFPPCTFLCKAQMWRCAVEKGRSEQRDKAVLFFFKLMNCNIPYISLENPSGFLSSAYRQSNQLVRPWFFGDEYDKEINLWTKNLPPLMSTCFSNGRKKVQNHVNGRMSQKVKSAIKSSWSYYPMMSQALASQYSSFVIKELKL